MIDFLCVVIDLKKILKIDKSIEKLIELATLTWFNDHITFILFTVAIIFLQSHTYYLRFKMKLNWKFSFLSNYSILKFNNIISKNQNSIQIFRKFDIYFKTMKNILNGCIFFIILIEFILFKSICLFIFDLGIKIHNIVSWLVLLGYILCCHNKC